MINHTKTTAVVFLSVTALLVTFNVACAIKAVPKKHDRAKAPSGNAATVKSEYQVLLSKYLESTGDIAKRHQDSTKRSWNLRVASFDQQANHAQLDESKSFEQLREASLLRPGKKLTFDGDVEENTAFVPSSNVSARIFQRLYKEGAVSSGDMVGKLASTADLLSSEWVPLVQDIAEHSDAGSLPWRSSRYTLYKMDVSRKQYRADLERVALDFSSSKVLRALLFDTNKSSGDTQPVRSAENTDLIGRILGEAGTSPELREVCAEYAAETGDLTQAEKTCVDLLSQQYSAPDGENKGPEHRDAQLHRARQFAMPLMFYKIRTAKCFEIIYKLSRTRQYDALRAQKDPTGWISLAASAEGRMDIDLAQSLMEEVADDGKSN